MSLPFLRALRRPRIQPSHERYAAETDLLPQAAMWDLVAPDELVDGVAPDPEHARDILDGEHRISRLLWLVRDRAYRAHGVTTE